MNWVGRQTYGCRHLAEFPIDEILALRQPWEDRTKQVFYAADGRRLKVRMNSIRYHLFARSRTCACCGIEGTVLLLDVHRHYYSRTHFNLYAVRGDKLILMTRDHITPRSKGGTDTLDNLQTLCTTCNNAKGSLDVTPDELRALIEKELVAA